MGSAFTEVGWEVPAVCVPSLSRETQDVIPGLPSHSKENMQRNSAKMKNEQWVEGPVTMSAVVPQ